MIQYQIENIDSICDFLYEMFCRYGGRFDLSINLENLNHNSVPVFSKEESSYLDSVMNDCFIYCVLDGVNINILASMVECDIKKLSHAA